MCPRTEQQVWLRLERQCDGFLVLAFVQESVELGQVVGVGSVGSIGDE